MTIYLAFYPAPGVRELKATRVKLYQEKSNWEWEAHISRSRLRRPKREVRFICIKPSVSLKGWGWGDRGKGFSAWWGLALVREGESSCLLASFSLPPPPSLFSSLYTKGQIFTKGKYFDLYEAKIISYWGWGASSLHWSPPHYSIIHFLHLLPVLLSS